MKLGMCIVNYNDYKTTKRLIDNIINYKCLDKIVVVDNKSTDNSLINLKKLESKKIKIIASNKNGGYSYALNIGCKYLIEEFKELTIIVSNSDIIIDSEDDLIELAKIVSDNRVVVAPTIIEGNNLNRGWKIPRPTDDILQNIFYFHRYFKKKIMYPDNYYHKKLSKVEVVSGSFFLINSKHLENINYFDDKVFLYYEENILGVKTKKAGKSMVVVNDIDVVHDHSVTIDKSLKAIKKYDILKQSQYYFEKYYNKANWLQLLLLKITTFITRIVLLFYYLIR